MKSLLCRTFVVVAAFAALGLLSKSTNAYPPDEDGNCFYTYTDCNGTTWSGVRMCGAGTSDCATHITKVNGCIVSYTVTCIYQP